MQNIPHRSQNTSTIRKIGLVALCIFLVSAVIYLKTTPTGPADTPVVLRLDSAACAHICAINERDKGKDIQYIWADSAEIAKDCPCFVDRIDDRLQANQGEIPKDSESVADETRFRWHDGTLFASKPNATWPWLIFDSAAYKRSKWFGKMDRPHPAQWIQRGELLPDGATVYKAKREDN